jgi:hypothetical protein
VNRNRNLSLATALAAALPVTMLVGCANPLKDVVLERRCYEEGREVACELRVTCKGDVKKPIYVDVASGRQRNSFGLLKPGPNGRDGSAGTSEAVIQLGLPLRVLWAVKGQSGPDTATRTEFATHAYVASAHRIKAIEVIYHGAGTWEMKVYDGSPNRPETRQIKAMGL